MLCSQPLKFPDSLRRLIRAESSTIFLDAYTLAQTESFVCCSSEMHRVDTDNRGFLELLEENMQSGNMITV